MSIAFPPPRAVSLSSSRIDDKKRVKKGEKSDFSYADPADQSPLAPLDSMGAFFSVTGLTTAISDQQSGSFKEKELIDRGNLLLDHLGVLRLNLLSGSISASCLSLIQDLLNQQKETVEDSELLDLIEEVNVRAAVELAKLNYQD